MFCSACRIWQSSLVNVAVNLGVTFSLDFEPASFLSVLSPYISIPFPLSLTDYIGLLLPFLLSLITPIVDCPLYYLVAETLSSYRCGGSYPVRYISLQSGVTVDLDYVPSP